MALAGVLCKTLLWCVAAKNASQGKPAVPLFVTTTATEPDPRFTYQSRDLVQSFSLFLFENTALNLK